MYGRTTTTYRSGDHVLAFVADVDQRSNDVGPHVGRLLRHGRVRQVVDGAEALARADLDAGWVAPAVVGKVQVTQEHALESWA